MKPQLRVFFGDALCGVALTLLVIGITLSQLSSPDYQKQSEVVELFAIGAMVASVIGVLLNRGRKTLFVFVIVVGWLLHLGI